MVHFKLSLKNTFSILKINKYLSLNFLLKDLNVIFSSHYTYSIKNYDKVALELCICTNPNSYQAHIAMMIAILK